MRVQHGRSEQREYSLETRCAGEITADKHQSERADGHKNTPAGRFVVDVQLFLPREEAALHQQGSGNEDTVPQTERNEAEVGAVPDADDQIHDKRSGRGGTDLAHHPIRISDTEADVRWILADGRWRDGGVWLDNGRWLDG